MRRITFPAVIVATVIIVSTFTIHGAVTPQAPIVTSFTAALLRIYSPGTTDPVAYFALAYSVQGPSSDLKYVQLAIIDGSRPCAAYWPAGLCNSNREMFIVSKQSFNQTNSCGFPGCVALGTSNDFISTVWSFKSTGTQVGPTQAIVFATTYAGLSTVETITVDLPF